MKSNCFGEGCANNEAAKHHNSHVGRPCMGYKIPQTISEEEGHRIETPSRGSERYYTERERKDIGRGWIFFLPDIHMQEGFLESQQWSPDGAAKAGLLHMLLVLAGGWRNEEVEGHPHDNHHNSGVSCTVKWLMTAINVAQEKRGYYICCGGEWCFALYKLEVQGNNSTHSLMGNVRALETALAAFVTRSPKWMEVTTDGWAVAGSITGMENASKTYIHFPDKSFLMKLHMRFLRYHPSQWGKMKPHDENNYVDTEIQNWQKFLAQRECSAAIFFPFYTQLHQELQVKILFRENIFFPFFYFLQKSHLLPLHLT